MLTRSQTRMMMQAPVATPKKSTRTNCTNSTQVMETPSAPVKHRYRTRSTTNSSSMNEVKKNLNQEFDAAFFDESSTEWNRNKTKLGNGMYAYRTRSTTRK